jgi:hypothetical protein
MTNIIRRLSAPLACSAVLAFGACSTPDKKPDTSLAQDTALNRDLQLASKDTTAQPQLRDVPAVPAPAPVATTPEKTTVRTVPHTTPVRNRPAPRVTPPPAPVPTTTTTASGNTVTTNPSGAGNASGGGAVGTIASGTALSLRSGARVCTNTYAVGQTFSATLANGVSGTNGASIPAGSTVLLEVTQLKRSENANDKIVMEFAVRSVSINGRHYPVTASVANADVERVRNEAKGKDVQKVAIGAGIGAIAGQILGRSTKGTIIGAAAGAAAGAGVAAGTANFEGCLPEGGNISVTLDSPLQVRITS